MVVNTLRFSVTAKPQDVAQESLHEENNQVPELNEYYDRYLEILKNGYMEAMDSKHNNMTEDDFVNWIEAADKAARKEDPTAPKHHVYRLTDKEKTERLALNKRAQTAVANFCAKNAAFDALATKYLKDNGYSPDNCRALITLMMINAKTPSDMLNDLHKVLKGTQEEKEQVLRDKFGTMTSKASMLSYDISTSDLLSYAPDVMDSLFMMNELDGSKVDKILEIVGLKELPKGLEEYNSEFKNHVQIYGNYLNMIFNIANPYYPVIDDRNGNMIYDAFTGTIAVNPGHGRDFMTMANDTHMLKEGVKYPGPIAGYASNVTFDVANKETTQLNLIRSLGMALLCGDKKDWYYIDSSHTVYTAEDFKMAERMLVSDVSKDVMKESRPYYDKLLNLVNCVMKGESVTITDPRGQYSNQIYVDTRKTVMPMQEETFEVYLTENSVRDSFDEMFNALKEVDPWYISSHKEFKDLRTAFEKLEKKGVTPENFEAALSNIKDLSDKYLASKYQDNTPKKTELTFEREKFCEKLSHSINNYYAAQYIKFAKLPEIQPKENRIEGNAPVNNGNAVVEEPKAKNEPVVKEEVKQPEVNNINEINNNNEGENLIDQILASPEAQKPVQNNDNKKVDLYQEDKLILVDDKPEEEDLIEKILKDDQANNDVNRQPIVIKNSEIEGENLIDQILAEEDSEVPEEKKPEQSEENVRELEINN